MEFIKRELIQAESSCDDTYTEWDTFYKNHLINSSSECIRLYHTEETYYQEKRERKIERERERENSMYEMDKKQTYSEPSFFDERYTSSHEDFKYKFTVNNKVMALFGYDYDYHHNPSLTKKDKLEEGIQLRYFLPNPNEDIVSSMISVFDFFKQEGWGFIELCFTYTFDRHPFIKKFISSNCFQKINDGVYLIPLSGYTKKCTMPISLKIRGRDEHNTQCSLVELDKTEEFDTEKYNHLSFKTPTKKCKTTLIFILFKDPIIVPVDDDVFFSLTINGIKYNDCQCNKNCNCTIASTYRRINKFWKIQANTFGLYNICYGFYFPKLIENSCNCSDRDSYVMMDNSHKFHNHIHHSMYYSSKWFSDEFNFENIRDFPTKSSIKSKYVMESCTPTLLLVESLDLLFYDPIPTQKSTSELEYDKEIVNRDEISEESNDESNEYKGEKQAGVYLIREREHVRSKRPVYKFGKYSQDTPSTKINRLGSYKKESEVIIIFSCTYGKENVLEDKIKEEFKKHFKNFEGREFFEGDINQMKSVFLNVCSQHI